MNQGTPHDSIVFRPAVGNPQEGRATFSRFLLPFSWSKDPDAANGTNSDKPQFRRAKNTDWLHPPPEEDATDTIPHLDAARLRYCTRETSELLYRRAAWFILDSWERRFTVRSGLDNANGRGYEVCVRPPGLVLFEEKAQDEAKGKDGNEDLLRLGFLVLEVYFTGRTDEPAGLAPPEWEDILRFNEIFRYVRCPFRDHQELYAKAELDSIHRRFGTEAAGDPYGQKWWDLLSLPVNGLGCVARGINDPKRRAEILVNPDDRSFTLAAAFLPSGVAERFAAGFQAIPAAGPTPGSAHWVALLNVDLPRGLIPASEPCSPFEHSWAAPLTYKRWAHYATLYGSTPHSLALLAPAAQDGGHGNPELALHAGQFYSDLTMLLLYIRCTLFRMSGELHGISCEARADSQSAGPEKWSKWSEGFKKLRRQFMLFENLYQWPMFSNQQQHLEMFAIQRQAMDIAELYEEIRREIQSSDEVLDNLMDQERNERANLLNQLAYYGLVFSLLLAALATAIASVQTFGPEKALGTCPGTLWTVHAAILALGVVLPLALTLVLYLYRRRKAGKRPPTPSKDQD